MFCRSALASLLAAVTLAGSGAPLARGAGPRWVAGSSYFDPSALGQPIVWRGGVVSYYTDRGDLSPTVTQVQANAMVAQAAGLWSGIPTAALQINPAGSLAEDVSGANFLNGPGGLTMPPDVQNTAINTPLGIIYDADGSVLDTLEGVGASDPDSCNANAVTPVVDNFSTDAKIAHALLIVNGRCTADPSHVDLVQYALLRGFGRILGLDWSQANDQMFPAGITPDGLLGWPLMHPVEKLCNSNGNPCMTGTIAPRTDDVAALNRLYPITVQNQPLFPGKQVTSAATISIRGHISFHTGQGMQGINVVARPLLPGTAQPDMRYPASAVSGQLFIGDAGNSVTGFVNPDGQPLNRFGTVAATLEGWYDLGGIPLPPGLNQADYQLTFEPVNPLYTGEESVGPYVLGQVAPSGTMPTVLLHGLTAGSTTVEDITIQDSAGDPGSGGTGEETAPVPAPTTGEWLARLSGYGQESWLRWHMQGGRQVTVEAQPVDELGRETISKALIVLGVWNADDLPGTPPEVGTPEPFNALPLGLTTLSFESGNDGDVRIAIADQRGDGRPDYLYRGRVLYAGTVKPTRIPLAGGPVVIDGMGFRSGTIVTVGGVAAQITSLGPTEITAIAPASANGASGNVDVTVTDSFTHGWATIESGSIGGLSYGPQSNDGLAIVSAPANALAIGVPSPFTVRALAGNGTTPAPGLIVTYAVTQGMASLGCGQSTCIATTGADGSATVTVTAVNTAPAQVTASLASGAAVISRFSGAAPPEIAAITSTLFLAAGAVFNWTPQALVLSNGLPFPGQTVHWTTSSQAVLSAASTSSGPDGIAWTQVTNTPLSVGQSVAVQACITGATAGCAAFSILCEDPSTAALIAISGAGQNLSVGDLVSPVVLRVVDANGQPLAGAQVSFYETLRQWTPPCQPSSPCPPAPVLASQTVDAISDASGLVTLDPISDGTAATRLSALAVTGDSSTLAISIERHP